MRKRFRYKGARAFLLDGDSRVSTAAFLREKDFDGERELYDVFWDCDPATPVSAIEIVDDVGCLAHTPVEKPKNYDPSAQGLSCTLCLRFNPSLEHGEYRIDNETTVRRC